MRVNKSRAGYPKCLTQFGLTFPIRILEVLRRSRPWSLGIFSHRHPSEPISPPVELDEYGIPVCWKRDPAEDPYHRRMLDRSAEYWPIFELWCEDHSLKAFPAAEESLLRFLLNPPVDGPELYETWRAVSFRHDAFYWVEDVDPRYLLKHGHGVDVTREGVVTIPDGIVLCDEMSDELIRELRLHSEGVSG